MIENTLDRSTREALTDEDVVARVLAGETALYEILVRRHNPRLYRAARAILRSESDVEDVMQDAYVRAYQHLREFEGRARFSTWLTRIAVNEAIARRHRSGRLDEWDAMSEQRRDAILSSTSAAGAGPRPDAAAASAEWRGVLERAIDALPANYRAVIVLREVEGLSTAEAAACLGITEDNVKVRLHRGLALLRRELTARFGAALKGAFAFDAVRCDRVLAGVLARIGAA